MRADYDRKANAISVTLVPEVEHAERADQVHDALDAAVRSALAVPDRVVVLDVLAPAA